MAHLIEVCAGKAPRTLASRANRENGRCLAYYAEGPRPRGHEKDRPFLLSTDRVTSMIPASATAYSVQRAPRTKVRAALLACCLGWLGAHWWYLGRRGSWLVTFYCVTCLLCTRLFPVWYDNPAFFLLFIPMIDGFIESVVLSLRADEKFDLAYNPGMGNPSRTGWGPVLVAIGATLAGAICSMFGIAMVVVYVWSAMGWLDGYVL